MRAVHSVGSQWLGFGGKNTTLISIVLKDFRLRMLCFSAMLQQMLMGYPE